jgi:hypothetical protein
MVQPEIVRIANTSDLTEDPFASEIIGFDVINSGYPTKICLVQAESNNRGACQRDCWDHGPRVSQRVHP